MTTPCCHCGIRARLPDSDSCGPECERASRIALLARLVRSATLEHQLVASRIMREALVESRGVVEAACEALGITRSTWYRYARRLGDALRGSGKGRRTDLDYE